MTTTTFRYLRGGEEWREVERREDVQSGTERKIECRNGGKGDGNNNCYSRTNALPETNNDQSTVLSLSSNSPHLPATHTHTHTLTHSHTLFLSLCPGTYTRIHPLFPPRAMSPYGTWHCTRPSTGGMCPKIPSRARGTAEAGMAAILGRETEEGRRGRYMSGYTRFED